ncbi:unnamed protein product [Larinioides sclopetarius]|uniref:Secreted protein n=1 Tax=Larinioides sclopetarius TaxID=280406 RepID=A0AAV2B5E9_9ARAC
MLWLLAQAVQKYFIVLKNVGCHIGVKVISLRAKDDAHNVQLLYHCNVRFYRFVDCVLALIKDELHCGKHTANVEHYVIFMCSFLLFAKSSEKISHFFPSS